VASQSVEWYDNLRRVQDANIRIRLSVTLYVHFVSCLLYHCAKQLYTVPQCTTALHQQIFYTGQMKFPQAPLPYPSEDD
jgi:hypothetical protein